MLDFESSYFDVKDNTENSNDSVINEKKALNKLGSSRSVVEIHYDDYKDNFSIRKVEVIRTYKDGRHWYVDANCQSAKAERTFRIDRIDFLTQKAPGSNVSLSDKKEILKYLQKFRG